MDTNSSTHIPIYKRLFNQYREEILLQKFPPGTRIDSINELVRKHRVSRETAKFVLKQLADQGLIIQKAGKGSFVSDLGPRNSAWGVIVPFFSAQVEGLLAALSNEAVRAGRSIDHFISYNHWQEEIRLVGTLIHQRYEAVIVVPTFDETRTASFYRNFVSSGSLVMLLDHTMAGSYFTYVIQSYDLGVKRAVEYLLQRSPSALAFVKNQIWAGRNMVQELMEETFINFVETASPSVRAFVVNRPQDLHSDWIRKNAVRGILCNDDRDAVGVIGRLSEWGIRIPEEVSVISYGNTDLAKYFTPKITSIDSHCEEMARHVSGIISLFLQGKDIGNQQHVIMPTLVVRET
jgi:DNA-binding LacI/PurR family transcriptional regulator